MPSATSSANFQAAKEVQEFAGQLSELLPKWAESYRRSSNNQVVFQDLTTDQLESLGLPTYQPLIDLVSQYSNIQGTLEALLDAVKGSSR
jgi:hypothetical protein